MVLGGVIFFIVDAEDDGDVLDDEELVAQTLLLYIAGHETTVNLIANGTLALLRHPGQLALLRDDPALVGDAVEELLRYDSPVQASRRITLEPVTVGGVTIPAGSYYNKYFPGHSIKMPPPLTDGRVTYSDGSPATVAQYSKDVTTFLMWTAEPHMEARKRLGMQVFVFLIIFTLLMYFTKKKVWADAH